jgi:hypothetical protein
MHIPTPNSVKKTRIGPGQKLNTINIQKIERKMSVTSGGKTGKSAILGPIFGTSNQMHNTAFLRRLFPYKAFFTIYVALATPH